MRIGILDHDSAQCAQLRDWLTRPANELQQFAALDALLDARQTGETDCMLVHWQPAINIRRLKEAMDQPVPPVPLLLVIEGSAIDQLTGLLGHPACDYLLRPLRRRELLIRLAVLQKRFDATRSAPATGLAFGPYVFDAQSEQLSLNGQPLPLTQKEFRLALLFFRHLNRPLSRAFILDSVWPDDADFSSRSVDTHVSRVRTKLALAPARGFRLAPVYGFGYRLEQIGG